MSKKALVTGSNKGIGKQIVRQLGQNGYTLLIGARDETRGLAAARELDNEGISAEFIRIDLLDGKSIIAAAELIKSQYADLSLLVNNAAIPGDMRKPGYDFTAGELRSVFETNFFGPFELTRLLLPTLERNNGRIVNMTIPIASSQYFNPFAYKTSKAAVNVMAQSLAVSFAAQSKTAEIFAIMPGATSTDLNGNITGDFVKTAEQAGKLIVNLILDGKNHNGEIINFDGILANYN
jgi:NAD(P)-dependent dehydrogenase (short-subunit alcohol dehydrogenase family)